MKKNNKYRHGQISSREVETSTADKVTHTLIQTYILCLHIVICSTVYISVTELLTFTGT